MMFSVLQINFHKSKIYGIGVSDAEVHYFAIVGGCEPSSFPFKYLGFYLVLIWLGLGVGICSCQSLKRS